MLHTVPINLFYALYHEAFVCDLDTVHQPLFVATLFFKVSKIQWFAVTDFGNQDVDYLENNIRDILGPIRNEKYSR